jgi:hypothetical protein
MNRVAEGKKERKRVDSTPQDFSYLATNAGVLESKMFG